MPYSFDTREGLGSVLRLKVRADTDAYILTAEFTKHPVDPFDPEVPFLTLPVEGSGRDVWFSLSAQDVQTIGQAYYRIRAVKTNVDAYIESGKINYNPTPQVAEVRGEELILIDQFGREYNAGNITGPEGPQGIQGIQGPQGAQGVQGPVGPAGLEWMGVWDEDTQYDAEDAVYHDGSSWFASDVVPIGDAPSLDPDNDWQPLAVRGAQGPQGAQGAQGPVANIDALGLRVGSVEADLLAATDLATNSTLVRRDATGGARFTTAVSTSGPTAGTHLVNKTYADSLGDVQATNNTIARRDGAGFTRFNQVGATATAPTQVEHLTRKDYVDAGDQRSPINAQSGTTYTFVAADLTRETHLNNAAAITATVPVVGSLPAAVGQTLQIIQSGAGQVTITPASTVTVRAPAGFLTRTRAQDSKVVAKLASNNIWILSGDLELATPSTASDIVRKDYADGVGTASRSYADALGTASQLNNTIVRRAVSDGRFDIATPTSTAHPTTKAYVDALGTDVMTADTVVRRSAGGTFRINAITALSAPSAVDHLTRKDYVDAMGDSMIAQAPASAGPGTVPLTAFPFENSRQITLAGNVTLSGLPTTPAATRSGSLLIILKQAATGGPYTVTWPATTSLPWNQGAPAPVMPTTANAEMIVSLLWTGTAWRAILIGIYYP